MPKLGLDAKQTAMLVKVIGEGQAARAAVEQATKELGFCCKVVSEAIRQRDIAHRRRAQAGDRLITTRERYKAVVEKLANSLPARVPPKPKTRLLSTRAIKIRVRDLQLGEDKKS